MRDLVAQAGGQVTVVSAAGRGATFEVRFPVAQPETSDGGEDQVYRLVELKEPQGQNCAAACSKFFIW